MGRPEKSVVQALIKELQDADKRLSETAATIARHRRDVRTYYTELGKRGVDKSLSEVPIECDGASIRRTCKAYRCAWKVGR